MRDEPWRAWYRTRRWLVLRLEVLVRDGYACRCEECQGRYLVPRATVVDHIVPHRGDEKLFWDPANLRAMAKRCHDAKTARETNARRRGEAGVAS